MDFLPSGCVLCVCVLQGASSQLCLPMVCHGNLMLYACMIQSEIFDHSGNVGN